VVTQPPAQGGGATLTTEAVYWHHNDHLGTPQALTDINGTVVWTMSQTPFGIATVNEDPDGDGIKVRNNFRFPGQYYDSETGLNYNYQRTYDPAVGRYTQSDPIGLNGGMNPFGYVNGNPVTGGDPSGLVTWTGAIVGVSGGMGITGGVFYLRLMSNCVNHERAKVNVIAIGMGPGFSLSLVKVPATGSGSSIQLDDGLPTIDPNALSGFFMSYVAGATAGTIDKSLTFINVGRARNKKNFFGAGASTDILSLGFSVIAGPSISRLVEKTTCGCKK